VQVKKLSLLHPYRTLQDEKKNIIKSIAEEKQEKYREMKSAINYSDRKKTTI